MDSRFWVGLRLQLDVAEGWRVHVYAVRRETEILEIYLSHL